MGFVLYWIPSGTGGRIGWLLEVRKYGVGYIRVGQWVIC